MAIQDQKSRVKFVCYIFELDFNLFAFIWYQSNFVYIIAKLDNNILIYTMYVVTEFIKPQN